MRGIHLGAVDTSNVILVNEAPLYMACRDLTHRHYRTQMDTPLAKLTHRSTQSPWNITDADSIR